MTKGNQGKKERRKLHRSLVDSQGARVRKKLFAGANRFKKRIKKDDDSQGKDMGGHGRQRAMYSRREAEYKELKVKSIVFVEQSSNGELAKRMRETLRSMEPIFRLLVVERSR